MGARRDGTVRPPGDRNRRRARDGQTRLRLVDEPPGPRKTLPPESAPFDPELDELERGAGAARRDRCLALSPERGRKLPHRVFAAGGAHLPQWHRSLHVGRVLVVVGGLLVVAGIGVAARTAMQHWSGPARSNSSSVISDNSMRGGVRGSGGSLGVADPFSGWTASRRRAEGDGHRRSAERRRPRRAHPSRTASARRRQANGHIRARGPAEGRAPTSTIGSATTSLRPPSSAASSTNAASTPTASPSSPTTTAPPPSSSSSTAPTSSSDSSSSGAGSAPVHHSAPAGPTGTGAGAVGGNCNPQCR